VAAVGPEADFGFYRKCNNYALEAVCNGMVPVDDPDPFCASCRLNRVIPNLSKPGNRVLWRRLERAKRRLIYDLHGLGLPVAPKAQGGGPGLAFEFPSGELESCLRNLSHHDVPLRTVNQLQRTVSEADPAVLTQDELHAFIDSLQLGLADIHVHLTESYFPPAPEPSHRRVRHMSSAVGTAAI